MRRLHSLRSMFWRTTSPPAAIGAIAFAACLLAAALAAPARAATEDLLPGPPIWATLQAGMMFPAGDEGSGLRRGAQAVGSLGYQLNPGFVVEGDLGIVGSGDDARTRIVMIGLHGRLNPNPYLRELYVVGGGAFYDIRYRARRPGAVTPSDKIRPGLSFGVGYDLVERARLTFGVVGTYHGIVIARSDALAYVTLGVYVSLRPPTL